jgi:hypothetical protein
MHAEKFKSQELIDATFNMAATTNHDNPIKLEGRDRRHVMIRTSPKRAQHPSYWAEAWAVLQDPEVLQLLLRHFFNLDLSGFVPSRIPNTAARQDTQLATRPPAAAFVQAAIERGTLGSAIEEGFACGKDSRLTVAGLKKAYEDFAVEERRKGHQVPLISTGWGVATAIAGLVLSPSDPEEAGFVLQKPTSLTLTALGLSAKPAYVNTSEKEGSTARGSVKISAVTLPSAEVMRTSLEAQAWWDG